MTRGLIIRRAQRRDAAELAILVDIASHGFASWLWYGAVIKGDVDTAMERGRIRMGDDGLDDGWKNASIAEIDGETVGASIGHSIQEEALDESPRHPSLAPLLALQQRVVGSRFIDSLAVYRSHRRKGAGRKLLEHELSLAGELPLSLVTESHNAAALSLYERFGFKELARLDAFKISEKSQPYQWVLMAKAN